MLYECNNIKYNMVQTINLFQYVLLHNYLNIHSFFNHSEPNDIHKSCHIAETSLNTYAVQP